jgi:hypothetical protein
LTTAVRRDAPALGTVGAEVDHRQDADASREAKSARREECQPGRPTENVPISQARVCVPWRCVDATGTPRYFARSASRSRQPRYRRPRAANDDVLDRRRRSDPTDRVRVRGYDCARSIDGPGCPSRSIRAARSSRARESERLVREGIAQALDHRLPRDSIGNQTEKRRSATAQDRRSMPLSSTK